ncbi:MAG: class A beta-lactamase-related serine hydrolase [Sporolactobacillus sp.]|jgi:beta-lactamase class A|nr:class A beta-lactamase-related serine hydrolase [Sporolactobacillus sp.]
MAKNDAESKLGDDLSTLAAPFGPHLAVRASGSDGFRFAVNGSLPMLSASLIKLPILLYACERSKKETDLFDRTVCLKDGDRVGGSGVLQVLGIRTWTLRDLLALMINVSDNTATNMLIDYFGTTTIQRWIHSQGYTGTMLARKLMDGSAAAAGKRNLINADNACRMITRIMTLDHLETPQIRSWFLHQQFRYKLPALFDERSDVGVCVYNKTGEMEQIDHDAAYFQSGTHTLSIAVLTSGIPDRREAFAVIQTIGAKIRDYLERKRKSTVC